MRNYILAFLIWGPLLLGAQSKWEAGVILGGMNYQGDLVPEIYPVPEETNLAYGIFSRWYFNPNFSFRLQGVRGQLSGNDSNSDLTATQERRYRFTTTLHELNGMIEWDPFGHKRHQEPFKFTKKVTPYGFIGGGFIHRNTDVVFGSYNPSLPISEDELEELMTKVENERRAGEPSFNPSTTIGGGLKFDFSRAFTLGVHLAANYNFTDYLDGVSLLGNAETNDWYWLGAASATFRFDAKDSDGDGIVDKEDACPRFVGAVSAKGCPDMDGDGVEDAEDVCPNIAGEYVFNGCPDTDGDDIMDILDQCPEIFGYDATEGCPDRDFDCVRDSLDVCPDQAGLVELDGCPDTDGDTFADHLDPCPTEAGLVAQGGCPLPDTDCDGILDRDDYCPEVPDTVGFTGCPDTDGDGLADPFDRCPDLKGTAAMQGCPEMEPEEKKVFLTAQKEVQFRTGSSDLTEESEAILDQLALVLKKYPQYFLSIRGYTDDQGKAESNQKLSERRAKACFDYLVDAGIASGRMNFAGLGESNPIGDNSTAEGRRLNRRVEFDIQMVDHQEEPAEE